MPIADELNLEYGFIDTDEEDIGSKEEREAALNEASLPSITPPDTSLVGGIVPPSEVPTQIPTGLTKPLSIPKPSASITESAASILGLKPGANISDQINQSYGFQQPIVPTLTKAITVQEPQFELPVKKESAADKVNQEYGLAQATTKISSTPESREPGWPMFSIYDDVSVPTEDRPKPKRGLISETLRSPVYGVLQLGEIASGLTAMVGETLKSDAITDLARDMYQSSQKLMEPWAPSVQDFRQIGGVNDAIRFIATNIGSMLPFMIGTFGAGAAARGILIKTLGPSIARKAAMNALGAEAAGELIKSGAVNTFLKRGITGILPKAVEAPLVALGERAGMAGMAAASVGAEAGIISSERLQNDMKVMSSGLLWAIPAGFLDVLPEWRLAKKMNLFGGRLSQIIGRSGIEAGKLTFKEEFAKQFLFEGITEGFQEILEAAGTGRKPFSYETLMQATNAFLAAGVAGGFMGAATNIFVHTPTEQKPTVTPTVEPIIPPKPPTPGELWAQTVFTTGIKEPIPHAAETILAQKRQGMWDRTYDLMRFAKDQFAEFEPTYPVQAMDLPPQMKNIWNKIVLGTMNPPPKLYGPYPSYLFYTENEWASKGLHSPWEISEIKDGVVTFTDFNGGKWEQNFDNKAAPGNEFSPYKYVDPQGNATILQPETELPQNAIDTLNDYLNIRQQVLGEVTAAETPPRLPTLPVPVSIIESNIYRGIRRTTQMGTNDLQVVAQDKNGKDVGRLWYTREPGGGFTIRKIEVEKEYQRQGIATQLFQDVQSKEGEYKGSTDITEEGRKFFRAIQPAIDLTIYGERAERAAQAMYGKPVDELNEYQADILRRRLEEVRPLETKMDLVNRPVVREAEPLPAEPTPIRTPGFVYSLSVATADGVTVRIGEPHRTIEGKRQVGVIPGLIDAIEGYVESETDMFYTREMYERKQRGEDVKGISREEIEKLQPEGFRTELEKLSIAAGNRFSARIQPIYYHLSERVILEKMTGPMASTQILAMLKNAGVRSDELKWTGLDELLQQPKKFTKDDILNFINQNKVEIKEVVYGEETIRQRREIEKSLSDMEILLEKTPVDSSDYIEIKNEIDLMTRQLDRLIPELDTKFAQWQLPGGEQYRELLLTLPNITEQYRSAHWDEPNVLAHVRFNERTDAEGKRILFIEEVQSDWHQAGREKGYRPENKDFRFETMQGQGGRTLYAAYIGDTQYSDFFTTKEAALADVKNAGVVPPAPFSKTWHELMMRRMVYWAAGNGFDRVEWTTGEQQAERYDLSKQITSISYDPRDKFLHAEDFGGADVLNKKINNPSEMEQYIGKEPTKKLLAQTEEYQRKSKEAYETNKDIDDIPIPKLTGIDLKVGGEGMKGFYDKILVDYMNKFGKKWGVKVGGTKLGTHGEQLAKLYAERDSLPEMSEEWEQINDRIMHSEGIEREQPLSVHSLDITPSMRESVMEGIPLFRRQAIIGEGMTIDQVRKVIDNFQIQLPENVLKFNVVNSPIDISPAQIKGMKDWNPTARAIYDRITNTIHVFAQNHVNAEDVQQSLFHELIGHFGFERLFGPMRMQRMVRDVIDLYGPEKLDYLYRAYNAIPGTSNGDYTVAMEKIAEIAQSGENPGLWQRFVTWFKEISEKIFGPNIISQLTEDDIRVYLWRSRQLIQNEQFQTMVQKYNAFVNLTGKGMWYNGLPDGQLGSRFHMRVDTSPSHVDVAENFSGWRLWYEAYKNRNKNFGGPILKDLGTIEAIYQLPHWVSMKFEEFKKVVNVEWSRSDKRNRDIIHLIQDPNTNSGDNPYRSLKDSSVIDKLVIWSDQNDFYLEDDATLQAKAKELVGRTLSQDEINAYRGWKGGFDRAIDYSLDKLRQTSLKLYEDRIWFQQLKDVLDGTTISDQVVAQLDETERKSFNVALEKTRGRLQRVAQLEKQLRSMNFYAPHIRGKGDYVVRVFDIDEEGKPVRVWVERFAGNTDAEAGRMRLQKEYSDLSVEKTHEPRTTEFIYGGLDVPAMEAFLESAVKRAEGTTELDIDKLMDSVYKAIDEEIMARGFRQHYIHRHRGQIIGGYRTEGLREVFFDYMSGLAGSMTKLEASYDFHKALGAIDKVNQKRLYEYSVRYVRDMLRNSDSMDRKLNAIKTLPFFWYLSLNLRLAATQMSQNYVTAYPILSRIQKDLGIKGSAAYKISRAIADIGTKRFTEEEVRMLNDAYNEGETMSRYIQTIKGEIKGGWAAPFSKFVDICAYPFMHMEKVNRQSSLLASFRIAREAGLPYQQAYELSKQFVRDAHYAYGLSNFPQLLRDGTPFSKIAGLGYVFKSFPHNYVLSMLHYARNREGRVALDVMMRSVAMLTLLGGLGAVPFLDDILDEYEKLTGNPVRSKMRKTLKQYGGELLGRFGMEGMPALAGIDMSGSIKMQIPIPGIGQFDPSTFTMGVWGGLLDKGKKAIDFAANNQWARAIEAASPTGIELGMKAARLGKEGLRTGAERRIFGPGGKQVVPTAPEMIAQTLGFRPERLAVVQKERWTAQNIRERFSKQRTDIYKRLRVAKPEDMVKIRRDIQSYNLEVMKYRGFIPSITAGSIRQAGKPEKGYMEFESIMER